MSAAKTSDRDLLRKTWEKFETLVLSDPRIGATQRQETRRAFYAGASAMFGIQLSVSELPETVAVSALEALSEELEAFHTDRRAGKA